jgi:DNA-binding transcriptional ArsR family regulator
MCGSFMEEIGGNPKDEVLSILADSRRRKAIKYLQKNGEAELEELTQYLEAEGYQEGLEAGSGVEIRLHHAHLPKLEEAGVISYDREEGKIEYRGDPQLERTLNAVEELDLSGNYR